MIKKKFKAHDKSDRLYKDDESLIQMVYQILAAYFEDACANDLTLDPVFNAILEKNTFALQLCYPHAGWQSQSAWAAL